MTDRGPDGVTPPATPIYDRTVEATAVQVVPGADAGHLGDDRAGQQAQGASGQAADAAKQTAGVAKEQAGEVADTAKDAGARVAGTTKDQASRVASDAVGQAKRLYGQASDQLGKQAGEQQAAAASTLRTLGGDLQSLQRGEGGGDGLAGELVDAIATRANRLGEWLDAREPAEVLDEVKRFAARRPGLFIALAAVTGVVAARATKALTADAKAEHAADTAAASRTTAPAPVTAPATVPDAHVPPVAQRDVPIGTSGYGVTDGGPR